MTLLSSTPKLMRLLPISGFPVKIDIPILPTVSAKITCQKFEFMDPDPKLFEIPANYVEDSMR